MMELLIALFLALQVAQLSALILILREMNGFLPGTLTSEIFTITADGSCDGERTETRQ